MNTQESCRFGSENSDYLNSLEAGKNICSKRIEDITDADLDFLEQHAFVHFPMQNLRGLIADYNEALKIEEGAEPATELASNDGFKNFVNKLKMQMQIFENRKSENLRYQILDILIDGRKSFLEKSTTSIETV